jgi:hypothetical protein
MEQIDLMAQAPLPHPGRIDPLEERLFEISLIDIAMVDLDQAALLPAAIACKIRLRHLAEMHRLGPWRFLPSRLCAFA